MGFEIRYVPEDWEHPSEMDTSSRMSTLEPKAYQPDRGRHKFTPQHDTYWLDEFRDWWLGRIRWFLVKWFSLPFLLLGLNPFGWRYGAPEPWRYGEYREGREPPNPYGAYRSEPWTEEERTHLQVYETVSEGTPVTPPKPDARVLAEWCAEQDQPIWLDQGKDWTADEWETWLRGFHNVPGEDQAPVGHSMPGVKVEAGEDA